MVAATTSSTIQRGADWTFAFQIREGAQCSALSDLTDWTWTATLDNAQGNTIRTVPHTLPTADCVSFSLTASQTTALTAQTGAQLTIVATRPDGYIMRLIRARITIQS
jgi:hypothetical protein